MANSALAVFNFQSHEVRIVKQGDTPWFVASDICKALDYANPSKAVADHLDDDERSTITNSESRNGGGKLTIINESGLYALVLRSRKPEARKFAKWVTSEVLPSIRKTGGYGRGAQVPYSELSAIQKELKSLYNRIDRLAIAREDLGEFIARPDEIAGLVGDAGACFTPEQVAQIVSAGAKRLADRGLPMDQIKRLGAL